MAPRRESSPPSQRLLGITVMGDYIVDEGPEVVLDNLMSRMPLTTVACNPTVTTPAAEGEGSFQPPDDSGSSPRLLDRPLWGQRALWVESAPSFTPRPELYRDTPYAPRAANELTGARGPLIDRFVAAARERGLKVFFQLPACQPPGLREDDSPRLPDGSLPGERMAHTGSLASEAIRAYNRAYVRDLFEHYPHLDGIRIDWPEYPCYTLDEAFQDFNPQAARWARERGVDFGQLKAEVQRLYDHLHGQLTTDELVSWQQEPCELWPFTTPDFAAVKAALSADLLEDWREAIKEAGGRDRELSANAFMPPWSRLTGFDFTINARRCHAASPKLYTMHWVQIVRFWGQKLLSVNPGLDERELVRALAAMFDLGLPTRGESLADYHYPLPEEAHPVSDAAQSRKLSWVLEQARGATPITPIVHGYGPLDDFARRFRIAVESGADGVWVNRYGYLSDDKLDVIGQLWQ